MDKKLAFTEFQLDSTLINALEKIGFTHASGIQEMTLEPVLAGDDIFALAETGSGKTGSFAIPITQKLIQNNMEGLYFVISPTRELAQQTDKVFNQIGADLGLRTVCVIGGESIDKQKEILEGNPQVIVATPGRLVDLVKQKMIDCSKCQGVVFDEADRLFDMGFKKDIEFVLNKVPRERQLVMVSATTNMDVLSTAYKFHSHPKELRLNEDKILVDHIDHKIAMIESDEKMPLLVNLLRRHEDAYAIIFCNTQYQTHLLAEWLIQMGFKAKPISGRLQQQKRTKLMEDFRSKEVTILVCTDVAARGLDIKDVNFVVNFDLPIEAANYVHRIGRTGRAGKSGEAISFCSFEDCQCLDAIYEYINSKIPLLDLDESSFANDICPKPKIDYKTLRLVDKDSEKSFDRRGGKKEKRGFDDKPVNLKPIVAAEYPSFVPSIAEEKSSRRFEIMASNEDDIITSALGYFQINDKELLNIAIKKLGRKKFFFFGPRTNTYEVTLKPIYKKLVTPFLIEIIKYLRLKIFVKVSFEKNTVFLNFTGADEKVLIKNNGELLSAFEQLARAYLINKTQMPRNLKVIARSSDSKKVEKSLTDIVDGLKSKVLKGKKPILMKPLNPAERRIVHEYLSKDNHVQTNSIGDGRLKRIEISLKSENA